MGSSICCFISKILIKITFNSENDLKTFTVKKIIVTPQITLNMALKLLLINTTLTHGLPMSHVTPKVRSLRGDPWGIACATIFYSTEN